MIDREGVVRFKGSNTFYHIFEKVNCEEGVKALCGSLHLEDLITLANELDRRLSFRPDWTRERFIEIMRDSVIWTERPWTTAKMGMRRALTPTVIPLRMRSTISFV